MPRYEDCESCVFYGREPAICDECEDADQWEPDDEEDWEDMLRIRGYTGKVIRVRTWERDRRARQDKSQAPGEPVRLKAYA